MAKKPSAEFKRFSHAMSKIIRVSKDELAKRELVDKERRDTKKKLEVHDTQAPASEAAGD